jgi:hypothetical protein
VTCTAKSGVSASQRRRDGSENGPEGVSRGDWRADWRFCSASGVVVSNIGVRHSGACGGPGRDHALRVSGLARGTASGCSLVAIFACGVGTAPGGVNSSRVGR